jgi:hypothetical protein
LIDEQSGFSENRELEEGSEVAEFGEVVGVD